MVMHCSFEPINNLAKASLGRSHEVRVRTMCMHKLLSIAEALRELPRKCPNPIDVNPRSWGIYHIDNLCVLAILLKQAV